MQPLPIQEISKRLLVHQPVSAVSIRGGSINQTYKLRSGLQAWFCKVNTAGLFPGLFQKERNGLAILRGHGVIAVAEAVDCFETHGQQVLLLEWIEEGRRTEVFWRTFGERLAALHRISHASFGLEEDNYMGSVPQQNGWRPTWVDFFVHQRLEPMIKGCMARGQLSLNHRTRFEKLYELLPEIFNKEPPSLLHGDLWSGNFMCNADSQPVLIDPAVYFGHRSIDLAMTTLFGGFDAAFYEAYGYHFPLPDNHKEQWAVANLYPLLIHLYLFGGSYLPQIERTLLRFA